MMKLDTPSPCGCWFEATIENGCPSDRSTAISDLCGPASSWRFTLAGIHAVRSPFNTPNDIPPCMVVHVTLNRYRPARAARSWPYSTQYEPCNGSVDTTTPSCDESTRTAESSS